MKRKFLRKGNGITLIALVITIIVLLILAGVAISMLSGENGILTKTTEARNKMDSESLIEQIKIIAMEAITNKEAKINETLLKSRLADLGIKGDDIISDREDGYIVRKENKSFNIKSNGNVLELDGLTEQDLELEKNFILKKSRYRCRYGYITGVTLNEKNEVIDKVKQLEDDLPEGYKVNLKYEYDFTTNAGEYKNIDESQKETIILTTGMAIQQNNKTVATVIIYGDLDCNGIINAKDKMILNRTCMFKTDLIDFQKIAANLYDDNELNSKDRNILDKILGEIKYANTQQDKNIKIKADNIKRLYKELQEYINLLDRSTGYLFEYNYKEDSYKLIGVNKDTTVEELINSLPKSEEISIFDKNGQQVTGESKVENGYYISRNFLDIYETQVQADFAYIEVK